MMRTRLQSWLIPGLLLVTMTYAIAEDLTLSTYYPSPRGVYNELQATTIQSGTLALSNPGNATIAGGLAVGPTFTPGNPGDVRIEGRVSIGTTSPTTNAPLYMQAQGAPATLLTLENIMGGTVTRKLDLSSDATNLWSLAEVGTSLQDVRLKLSNLDVIIPESLTVGPPSLALLPQDGGIWASHLIVGSSFGGFVSDLLITPQPNTLFVEQNVAVAGTTPPGNITFGSSPNGQNSGNINANDVFLRSVPGGAWASQVGSLCQIVRDEVTGTAPPLIAKYVVSCPANYVVVGGGVQCGLTGVGNIVHSCPSGGGLSCLGGDDPPPLTTQHWFVQCLGDWVTYAYAICCRQ